MPQDTTPRIRNDLKATPAEEQGIRYFDVSDPRSGTRMRMYDFEWLIAERMNGARRFDEVASWARDALGLDPTTEDLAQYARRLHELGFFELDGEAELIDEDLTPLPQPSPGDLVIDSYEDTTSPVHKIDAEPERTSTDVDQPQLKIMPPDTEINVEEEGPTKPMPLPPALSPVPRPLPAPPPQLQEVPREPAARTGGSTDRLPTPPEPVKRGPSFAMIGIVVLMIAIAGIVGYMTFFKPQSAHVSITLATPREVVRLYDGTGAVKKSEPQLLSFGEAGKVTDVVAKGTEAKPGMPLATLEAYPQIEKLLADVRDRLAFYQKQLESAKSKNAEEEVKKAESKVAEKKKILADLEARAARVRLIAPASGTVTEVMITAGADAKPGAAAIKVGEKRLSAEFKVAAAEAPKAGDNVTLQPAGGGVTIAGRVTTSANGDVVVELPDAAPVKPGDQLRLVKKREQNVVPVPASAIVKREGSDTVFVLSNGEAHARKVVIVDRTSPSEVLISSGLATGDSVITSGVDTLQDGQKASVQ